MAKINDVTITSLLYQEGSAPSTPASTKWRHYFKTDGLYVMDDAGVETGPLAASSGGISSGTAFPGAPSDNDLFFRTDRGLMYYYRNSLSKWHTTNLYRVTMPNTIAANTTTATGDLGRLTGPASSGYAWYLERFEWTAYVVTTNDGTRYWTCQLEQFDGGTKTSVGSALSTVSLAADQYHALSTTSVAGEKANTVEEFQFTATKVSTAGTLIVAPATLVYRMVG